MTVHLSQATARELPDAARVVAGAFRDDAVMALMVRGERNRTARLTDLVLAELSVGSFADGVVDVARLEVDGPIVGVGAWTAPGHGTSPWAQLRQLPRYVRGVGVTHLWQARRTLQVFVESSPKELHWYLADIAVSADARGHGVGGELLRHRLAAVDAASYPAYLEATTPDSRRLYERHGFELRAPLNMVAGGYPVGMWRPARTA